MTNAALLDVKLPHIFNVQAPLNASRFCAYLALFEPRNPDGIKHATMAVLGLFIAACLALFAAQERQDCVVPPQIILFNATRWTWLAPAAILSLVNLVG
jgi:hypothetical protein